MADFLTHQLFGETVLPMAEAAPMVTNRDDISVFLWGNQGPDPFFYRKALTGQPLAPLANRLHNEDPGRFFYAAARFAALQEGRFRQVSAAYLAGLLGHYALDCAIHPYVAARQKDLKKICPGFGPSALHVQIETDIDNDLFVWYRKKPVSGFAPWEQYRLDDVQREVIDRLWRTAAAEMCDTNLAPGDAISALDDQLRLIKLTYKRGITHAVAQLADVFAGGKGSLSSHVKYRRPRWDSLNLAGRGWRDLDGIPRVDTVPDILAQARAAQAELLRDYNAMLETGDIRYRIYEKNYGGERI